MNLVSSTQKKLCWDGANCTTDVIRWDGTKCTTTDNCDDCAFHPVFIDVCTNCHEVVKIDHSPRTHDNGPNRLCQHCIESL